MPELPDVENFRRYFDRHAVGRLVEGVHAPDARILRGTSGAEVRKRIVGHRFVGAERYGKHLLARLDDGGIVTFHFGMTGSFAEFGDGEDEPRFERLRLDFEGGRHLAFTDPRRLGRVGMAGDAAKFVADEGLGIDALDSRLTRARLKALLGGRRVGIKAALMDQARIAGIGNIFSDEILFRAGIDPRTDAAALRDDQVARLHGAIKRVLKDAIARGAGSETFIENLPDGWLLRHRSAGETCPGCGGEVRTLRVGGRTAYYCPRCQPRRA